MVRSIFFTLNRILFFLCVCYVYIICSIIHFSYKTTNVPVDCALVFGSAVHGTSYPGPGIARRVSTAALIYHNNLTNFLIMSGGSGRPSQQSEAEVMQRVAQRARVPLQNIFIEARATSTKENIQFSREILQTNSCKTVVLISDPYHLARISLLMQFYAPEVSYRQHGTSLNAYTSFYFWNVIRESLAIPYVTIEWALSFIYSRI